jgi:hypothetical protein
MIRCTFLQVSVPSDHLSPLQCHIHQFTYIFMPSIKPDSKTHMNRWVQSHGAKNKPTHLSTHGKIQFKCCNQTHKTLGIRICSFSEGDRNIAFFFSKASARTNLISTLLREDGSVSIDQTKIKGMVHNFYEEFFNLEPLVMMATVLDSIPNKVNDQMNEYLCRP